MNDFGKRLKNLRKNANVTQEQLAEYLGISYQAVSKWETGIGLPDISLLPRIANFFKTTTDELLGLNQKIETDELCEYEKEYRENNRLGKTMNNIILSRKVLQKYPRNFDWMLNLAYPLLQYEDTAEHKKYSLEHHFTEEAICICERILRDCTSDYIRHGAIQILCINYPKVNKRDLAIKMAKEMPNMSVSKEWLLFHALEGNEKIKQAQANLFMMIDNSASYICLLSKMMKNELSIKERIEFIITANKLYEIVFKNEFVSDRLYQNYIELATLYCEDNEPEKAIENLLLAERMAYLEIENENKGEQKYTSLFMNHLTYNPKNTSKNYEENLVELLLNLLNDGIFDLIRDNEKIISLKKRLIKSVNSK